MYPLFPFSGCFVSPNVLSRHYYHQIETQAIYTFLNIYIYILYGILVSRPRYSNHLLLYQLKGFHSSSYIHKRICTTFTKSNRLKLFLGDKKLIPLFLPIIPHYPCVSSFSWFVISSFLVFTIKVYCFTYLYLDLYWLQLIHGNFSVLYWD